MLHKDIYKVFYVQGTKIILTQISDEKVVPFQATP